MTEDRFEMLDRLGSELHDEGERIEETLPQSADSLTERCYEEGRAAGYYEAAEHIYSEVADQYE